MYIDLEDYMCDGCRVDVRCGSCPNNEERISEWHRKYGEPDSSRYRSCHGYGFNILD